MKEKVGNEHSQFLNIKLAILFKRSYLKNQTVQGIQIYLSLCLIYQHS